MAHPEVIAIILTFNSEASLEEVIVSCRPVATRTVVVDSFSTDKTLSIAEAYGCEIVQHAFENYSRQRNWAQQYVAPQPDDWLLHLDSDEVISAELCQSLQEAIKVNSTEYDGYLVRRLSYFMGSPIRFGHINPSWHLRLFRASRGFCEDRLYDQHFIVPGQTQHLRGLLLDRQITTLEKWTAAHNRWSTAEAEEVFCAITGVDPSGTVLKASLRGDLRMKKRWLKNYVWYRCPLFIRPILFFFYTYFLRLGFLDGQAGLVYHVLQAFWFRFLVDAKILERQKQARPA